MEMSNGNVKQQLREKQVNPQEADVQGTIMDIENELENACNQGDPHPPHEDSATPADRPQGEKANNNNNSSRTKKMKLETGNERQIERKRSRSRTAPHKKDKIGYSFPTDNITPTPPPTRQYFKHIH
jgi:hypothetical protein